MVCGEEGGRAGGRKGAQRVWWDGGRGGQVKGGEGAERG